MSTTPASPAAPAADPAQPLRFQDSDVLRLINVEADAAAQPETFLIPSREERERLRVGSFAQLIFCNQPSFSVGGLLWVRVTEAREGRYEGLIDSDPVVFPGLLRCGMVVAFGPEHIARCETAADPAHLAGEAEGAAPADPAPPVAGSAAREHLQLLQELSGCWLRAAGAPAGVPSPRGPVDPATLFFCGAVVQGSLLKLLMQADEDSDDLDDDPLATLMDVVTDSWISGRPGAYPPPASLDPETLRYCGTVIQGAIIGLVREVVREEEEEAAAAERTARAVRGLALFLWRVWSLAQELRVAAPPEGATEDLWQHIDRQLQRAADRMERAAKREGRCAVQEGCGRPHETIAQAPPDRGAFQGLLAALAALGAAWQDTPPASHRFAGDELAALLRAHRALHDQAAPGLCAACRPIFLGYLAPTNGEAG